MMDHTNFPMAAAIPLEVFAKFEDKVDWDEVYGRYGTETHIYAAHYNGENIPPELKGIVTHVWMYWEK